MKLVIPVMIIDTVFLYSPLIGIDEGDHSIIDGDDRFLPRPWFVNSMKWNVYWY